ncbi:hypothetical protein BU23DRAFT_570637 [Bimuria novae-zelandiae CBS 107.79]|uniref:DUF7918 domain-containing protein n=1 Tax=Bimuria novae-zelandiae CBS 107.79 TaxID=1447943 RepID=A0A6A5V0Q7_9PLEO|nr:hypothetical protein BU23DRAFT_570637 [Bimuria novae-zelandiae CBS 107.79]
MWWSRTPDRIDARPNTTFAAQRFALSRPCRHLLQGHAGTEKVRTSHLSSLTRSAVAASLTESRVKVRGERAGAGRAFIFVVLAFFAPATAIMAIIPDCPGLKVEVIVDGNALKEYDDYESRGNGTTNLRPVVSVESVSGAKFQIRITYEAGFSKMHGVRSAISIDGNFVASTITRKSRMTSGVPLTISGITSRVSGQTMEAAFKFSDLMTSKGGVSPGNDISELLGKIKFQFHYIKNITRCGRVRDRERVLPMQEAVPAKAASLGALSHVVRGAEPMYKRTTVRYMLKYDKVEKDVFAAIGLQISFVSWVSQPAKLHYMVDINVLLNHYTGRTNTWKGFDRAALGALLGHHKAARAKSGDVNGNGNRKDNDNSGKKRANSDANIKREREDNRDTKSEDTDDFIETGSRPVKLVRTAKKAIEVIELD